MGDKVESMGLIFNMVKEDHERFYEMFLYENICMSLGASAPKITSASYWALSFKYLCDYLLYVL